MLETIQLEELNYTSLRPPSVHGPPKAYSTLTAEIQGKFTQKKKEKLCESDLTYGQVWWLILRICALQLTHPKCTHTHTQQWTHTHTLNTHPEPVGSHLCCGTRGAVGGSVPCSSALKVERALDIHSPHLQSLPDQTQTRNLWIMSPTLLPLGHVFPFARYHDCFISTSEENPSLDLTNLVWFVISNSKKNEYKYTEILKYLIESKLYI